MNLAVRALMGLILGYLLGIVLAVIAAKVFGLSDIARYVAIGCGIAGLLAGPIVFARWQGDDQR